MTLYLDHNIYIRCLYNDELKGSIITKRNELGLSIAYSPAHIEKYFGLLPLQIRHTRIR